jgi:hypothetical protein
MGKNLYERRLARQLKRDAESSLPKSIKWHEKNVVEKARQLRKISTETGAKFTRALAALDFTVDELNRAYLRVKINDMHGN